MKSRSNGDNGYSAQTPREHVNHALRSFLDDPKPGVLAIKGAWGIGKTYIWNLFLKDYRQDAKQDGYSYVSLFGINSTHELRQFTFAKHESLASDKKKRFWQKTKKYGPNILSSIDLAPATLGLLKNTEAFSEWFQDKLLRNFIVCIDDLERKEDSLTGSALLGFITSLREERKCKVILIYNDAEISAELNESFGEYREKVIDREVEYSPAVEDNFRLIFPESAESCNKAEKQVAEADAMFGSDSKTLLQLFECLKVTNIRVFQKTKIALDYFTEYLRERYPKLYPQFVRQTVKICCLYYLYGDRWSLEHLVGESHWSDYLSKDDIDPEKAKERTARQPIRDISYDSKSTDVIVAEFLKVGYVDWKSHTSLLNDTEKQFEAGELNSELTEQWSKYWGNFTTPQESFVRGLQDFIITNWSSLRLQEVDSAARFLKKIDPTVNLSEIVEKRIALFVEKHIDADPFHLDLHNVDPDTVKRVKALLISRAKQIPIGEAIDRLTQNGGWSPTDIKYLVSATTDQFYEFFTASDKPYFLAKIKELRSRLPSSEGGKPVLDRIDDALRRLAKRSKLDEFRVTTDRS